MTQSTPNVTLFRAETAKPDEMVTLACKTCRMALYMSRRELQKPTWQCPACGTITKP